MVTKKEVIKKIEYLKNKIGKYEILNNLDDSFSLLSNSNIYLSFQRGFNKIEVLIYDRNKQKRYNPYYIEYSNKEQKEFIRNSFINPKSLEQAKKTRRTASKGVNFSSYKPAKKKPVKRKK